MAHFFATTIGVVALGLAARAAAQPAETFAVPTEPAEVVAALHAGIVAAAKDPKRNVEERYAELEPLIERTHDLPYIAELSIRRYWAGLTDEQRLILCDPQTSGGPPVSVDPSRRKGLLEVTPRRQLELTPFGRLSG